MGCDEYRRYYVELVVQRDSLVQCRSSNTCNQARQGGGVCLDAITDVCVFNDRHTSCHMARSLQRFSVCQVRLLLLDDSVVVASITITTRGRRRMRRDVRSSLERSGTLVLGINSAIFSTHERMYVKPVISRISDYRSNGLRVAEHMSIVGSSSTT